MLVVEELAHEYREYGCSSVVSYVVAVTGKYPEVSDVVVLLVTIDMVYDHSGLQWEVLVYRFSSEHHSVAVHVFSNRLLGQVRFPASGRTEVVSLATHTVSADGEVFTTDGAVGRDVRVGAGLARVNIVSVQQFPNSGSCYSILLCQFRHSDKVYLKVVNDLRLFLHRNLPVLLVHFV